jgi:hypothetical protein
MFVKLFYKIEKKGERLFYITNHVWINSQVPNNITRRALWMPKLLLCLYPHQADHGSLTWPWCRPHLPKCAAPPPRSHQTINRSSKTMDTCLPAHFVISQFYSSNEQNCLALAWIFLHTVLCWEIWSSVMNCDQAHERIIPTFRT